MTLTEQLNAALGDAFRSAGFSPELGAVSPSDRPELCEFQCNGAFAATKQAHKPPIAVAEEIASRLQNHPLLQSVTAAKPGFINLTVSSSLLIAACDALYTGAEPLMPQTGKGKTVVLDYGGPNVAKPLHIGHLRPAIIGESVKRLCRAAGYRTVADIHLGDWGTPIGLVMEELKTRRPDWRCFSEDFSADEEVPELSLNLLQEVYPLAAAKAKEDPAFKEAAGKNVADLQQGKPGALALWKEIMRVSLPQIRRCYDRLSVSFDCWLGESDAKPYIAPVFERLREKGMLRESDGALVADIAKEDDDAPMPPIVVQKSDGCALYATTDLATLLQRQEDYAPDAVWYVADKRQSLHFEQVFRCAKAAGLVPADTDLRHLSFGTVNGADGKPYKTRDGGVMPLSRLLDFAAEAAEKKLTDSAYLGELTPDQKRDLAQKVGTAAIKFGDLVNHRSKDYIFDLDKFLSFEGKTGVYLLYTVARIRSLLKKADNQNPAVPRALLPCERALLLNIAAAPETLARALDEQAPNFVCESAYQIACAFSRFYHDCPVLAHPDADVRASRLWLCELTERVLTQHLEWLGISPVDNL